MTVELLGVVVDKLIAHGMLVSSLRVIHAPIPVIEGKLTAGKAVCSLAH